MANNVKFELELYRPMQIWLEHYLKDKYYSARIVVADTHSQTLDSFLEKSGHIDQYPQIVGLDIQIDVLGIVQTRYDTRLVFIEAKKTPLNLHDLGQLWAYCKLCDPAEAFLLSSVGVGSLGKIVQSLSREDILDFGDGRQIKKMQIGKWNLSAKAPDYKTLLPKL